MVPSHTAWVSAAIATYEAKLLRYAADIVGPSLARDVVQDTFLKLCRADRDLVQSHLSAWLFTVCRNAALEIRRKVRRLTELDPHAADGAPAAGESLERAESIQRVQEGILALPERQREIVRLKFDAELIDKAARLKHRPSRPRLWLMVACASLFILPAAAYHVVVVPERERVSEQRAKAERVAFERALEAQRLQAESEQRLRRAQEEARLAAASAAAQAVQAQRSLCADGKESTGSARESSQGRVRARAAGKSGRKNAGASGACDPNDPLCGL